MESIIFGRGFIRNGQVYRTVRPISIGVVTGWHAPFTGGYNSELPADFRFRVSTDPSPGAAAVSCEPERYHEYHAHFVPVEDRKSSKYAGYGLVVNLEDVLKNCELDEEAPWNPC